MKICNCKSCILFDNKYSFSLKCLLGYDVIFKATTKPHCYSKNCGLIKIETETKTFKPKIINNE